MSYTTSEIRKSLNACRLSWAAMSRNPSHVEFKYSQVTPTNTPQSYAVFAFWYVRQAHLKRYKGKRPTGTMQSRDIREV